MVTAYFCDSSALVKRYIAETGTSWIQTIADDRNNLLIVARITWVEAVSAFARRRREKTLSAAGAQRAIRALRSDMALQYEIVELDVSLSEAASDLIQKHPLRAYDAVQLATAFKAHSELGKTGRASLTFVSADTRLLRVAQSAGLKAENPIDHP